MGFDEIFAKSKFWLEICSLCEYKVVSQKQAKMIVLVPVCTQRIHRLEICLLCEYKVVSQKQAKMIVLVLGLYPAHTPA